MIYFLGWDFFELFYWQIFYFCIPIPISISSNHKLNIIHYETTD